jgi:hypothetical protein
MNELRKDIINKIKSNRPKISDSSLKTYSSLLINLNKKMDGGNSINWYKDNKKDILEFIKTNIEANQSKKTLLSALFVMTEDEGYKEIMETVAKTVNEAYKTQKMNTKQTENRVTIEEIKTAYDKLKKNLRIDDTVQNYIDLIVLSMMSGLFFPPRRNEWAIVKVKNFDEDKDNYYKKGIMYFNIYKTVAVHGKQSVKLPHILVLLVNKFIKISNNDYLIFNQKTKNHLSSSELTKRLHFIFKKEVGCDTLRSVYITELYKNVPKLKELEEVAKAMGHQIFSAMNYYDKKE